MFERYTERARRVLFFARYEASQLGIESLFLFFIAKKIVVVGDDQQISPYGVGIPDKSIAGLQRSKQTPPVSALPTFMTQPVSQLVTPCIH